MGLRTDQVALLRSSQVSSSPALTLACCFATVCKNLKEVRAYFKEEGADIAGMSSEELAEQAEVFALPDGRYLIVEA